MIYIGGDSLFSLFKSRKQLTDELSEMENLLHRLDKLIEKKAILPRNYLSRLHKATSVKKLRKLIEDIENMN